MFCVDSVAGKQQKSLTKSIDIVHLTQNEIEDSLLILLKNPARDRRPIQKLIPEKLLAKLLVYLTEVFRQSAILLDVTLKQRCLVIGDLHSSFNDLLCVLYYGDLPPAVNYIFLGDYTGRGQYRLETLIMVMLLKLRWPNNVFMLRGRNETVQENPNDPFYNAVLDAYNSKKIFYLFAQMFDYMPIAAIVNDAIFCCHGGISQWLSSREVLQNIQRPFALKNMTHLEGCLITDLLWADPAPTQKRPFIASTRGASYTFNDTALRAILRAIDCTHLIRSNAEVMEGIREDFRDKCFTVYSAHGNIDGKSRGIYLALALDINGNVEIDRRRDVMEIKPSACKPNDWCHYITNFMQQSFIDNPCNYLHELSAENLFTYYNIMGTVGEQIVTHTTLTNWVLDNGMEILEKIKHYFRTEHIPPNARYFPHYFPLLYDLLYGNGGTFRVILTATEQRIINKAEIPICVEKWPEQTWDIEIKQQQIFEGFSSFRFFFDGNKL